MTLASELKRLRADAGDLLDRHDGESDLSRFSSDPVGFIRKVTGGEPWAAQVEIAEGVRDHPLVAVRSCNAAGKDWLCARLALWWVYARGGLVLLTGPTERQVAGVLMAEVRRAWSPSLPGELYGMSLRVEGSGGILAFTSTEASRLTGFHHERVMGIITEAQGVESFCYEGLLACAAGPEDRILAVGNPLNPKGRFYSACRNWKSYRIAASDHPNVIQGKQIIPGGVSRAFIDRIRSEFGEDSGTYKARVLGEFPENAIQGLVRRSWIERAMVGSRGGGRVVLGVDVARFGESRSCVAEVTESRLTDLTVWGEVPLTETVNRIELCGYSARRRANSSEVPVVVDEPGVGGGVIDQLRDRRWDVVAFNGARRANKPERYANLRAEAWWELREALRSESFTIVEDVDHLDDLVEELIAVEWGVDGSGRIAIQPKADLRSRLRRSPDLADALTLAVWYSRRRVPDLPPSYW